MKRSMIVMMLLLGLLSLVVGIVACDAHSPLSVKDPDVPSGPAINNASFLPYLRVGAISNFAVAYVGAADQSTNAHEGQAKPDRVEKTRCDPSAGPAMRHPAIPIRRIA